MESTGWFAAVPAKPSADACGPGGHPARFSVCSMELYRARKRHRA